MFEASRPYNIGVPSHAPNRRASLSHSTATQLRCANNKTHSRKPSAICSLCEPKTRSSPFSRNSGGILWKA
ncbi:conserved hypothetical protein [Brugia malayi]|uniref:Bm13048 n=1 Tax=Brugia malayi TaxID=6279 RepID=A0A0J9XQA6_BRUMA|nr:uncharacterized protein BM_BM13048 [Brugia malayi]CDP93103.1 Bm13048 [Brugia malayi]VIO87330.1 conserved hypothetical protein [Brugia malayi]